MISIWIVLRSSSSARAIVLHICKVLGRLLPIGTMQLLTIATTAYTLGNIEIEYSRIANLTY